LLPTASYSFAKGKWRGPDFAINAGDGIFVGGIQTAFDWVIVGTDFETTLDFTATPKRVRNYNWISVPYTCDYDSASSMVNDIEFGLPPGSLLLEVGKWDPATQSAIIYYFDGAGWTGTDFAINPGDGIYLLIKVSFSWTPLLITPAV